MNILNPRVDAPREMSKLMELDRTALYILGMHLGIFKGTADEQAFVASPAEQQCQRVREELLFRDANGWPNEGQPMPAVPTMPDPEPQPQEPPAESIPMQQPPQFPRPVIPSTVGQPTQQPVTQLQQPPMPMQAPPQMPVYPPPQMGNPPQMPAFPQPPQQQPQFPQVGGGLPQMQAPQWQMPAQPQPQAAPPQQQGVLPSGRAPAVPGGGHPSGLGDVLTKIAEVQAANQKLLEAIHKQGATNGALLQKILGILITMPQVQGFPLENLVQAVAQAGGEEQVKGFLQAIGGGPTQGKA